MTYIPGSLLRTPGLGSGITTGASLLEQVNRAIAAGFPGTPLATKRIVKAAQFAAHAHRDQVRKGPKRLPYILHPIDVAVRLSWAGQDEDTICAGFLHDVVEDCGVEPGEIAAVVGMRVAQMVVQVTNVTKPTPGMNRKQRQEIEREHLSHAWPEMKNLKLVDTYCNVVDVAVDDPKFAPTYLAEKRLLLPVLKEGSHPVLYQLAADVVGLAA